MARRSDLPMTSRAGRHCLRKITNRFRIILEPTTLGSTQQFLPPSSKTALSPNSLVTCRRRSQMSCNGSQIWVHRLSIHQKRLMMVLLTFRLCNLQHIQIKHSLDGLPAVLVATCQVRRRKIVIAVSMTNAKGHTSTKATWHAT